MSEATPITVDGMFNNEINKR